METFLGRVAAGLYEKYGDEISSLHIVMPNMRSRVFFTSELSRIVGKPVWQPNYATVDELMREIAGVTQVDRIRAVVELYKVYSELFTESFESFYFWGEMLLSDFDQIDKYMVDAGMLFANLSDLKALDLGLEYFTEQQRSVVERFWAAFGEEHEYSDEKHHFMTIWSRLAGIYETFRARLSAEGCAYTGMMHRVAAEKIKEGSASAFPGRKYAIVGFNALSACEKVLFDHLRNVYGAEFFWDYDDYYYNDERQEAGIFMRENVSRYPQPSFFINKTDNFNRPKEINVIAVPSDSMQCKYASAYIGDILKKTGSVGKETAIVLTNEELLVPLLYSVPEEAGTVNVTMGYPLKQSLAYSFVERLLKLQAHIREKGGEPAFYHADVTGLLAHPYVVAADAENAERISADVVEHSRIYVRRSAFLTGTLIEKIFAPQADWQGMIDYIISVMSDVAQTPAGADGGLKQQRGYFGIIAETLRKLANSLRECSLEISLPVLSVLARRMLQSVQVPYEGEPLKGVQVMGILETRNIDFENVLMLSMNDDNFPGNVSASSSFIPHNLRYAYGLPTPQHHDGVYAYYFYRLLQRAGRVDLAYCSRNDENSSGEQSRYIYQLDYESRHEIRRREVALNVNLSAPESITVDKTPEVMASLGRYLESGGRTMSPTAFNAFLDCPLKFYFRYVAGVKPADEVTEEVDASMFGTILHKAMEILYTPVKGKPDARPDISALIGSEKVGRAVDEAIDEVYYSGTARDDISGDLLMARDIVCRYINNAILPYDAGGEPFAVADLEQDLYGAIGFGAEGRRVHFSGKADRVDMLPDGVLRIVDYKTGSPHRDFAGLDALFGDEPVKRAAIIQTFLYSAMARQMQRGGTLPGRDVRPALYYVRMMNRDDYSPLLNDKAASGVMGYSDYGEDFEDIVREKLSELFDPGAPFVQCEDAGVCAYCDYDTICRRR